MRRHCLHIALVMVSLSGPWVAASERSGRRQHAGLGFSRDGREQLITSHAAAFQNGFQDESSLVMRGFPVIVRPGTLASQIGELAGHMVKVPYSRVVGLFNPRVFLIDTATRLPPIKGHRDRVLVFVEPGGLSVTAASIVATTVTVVGTARTLLGMQVSREVPWPTELRPESVERLEIKAAVLATSVQTADGVELTTPQSAPVSGPR